MRKYKFKLSDMIPNAWFHKLKDGSRQARNQKMTHPTKQKHQQTSSSLSYLSSSSTVAQSVQSEMQQSHLSDQRKSYHFVRDNIAATNQDTFYDNLSTRLRALDSVFPEPPRKSSQRRRSTKRNRSNSNWQSPRLVTSSVSAGCNSRVGLESVWAKPDSTTDDYTDSAPDSSSGHESLERALVPETFDDMLSLSTSCQCRVDSDFIIDKPFDTKVGEPDKQVGSDHTLAKHDLPPIITKPSKSSDAGKDSTKKEANEPTKTKRSQAKFEERNAYGSFSVKIVKEEIVKTSPREPKPSPPLRRSSVHSPGVKLRTNSPRIGTRRVQGRKSSSSSSSSGSRKDLSESFAVVKSSKDPQKDFKESMVEMIVENNIFSSKDLEDLLACYLSLNSNVYHDMIVKVFKQIWFDIVEPKLK